jgi:phytoene dehydrogenase-like protein
MPLRTANIVGSGPNGLAAAITLAQRGVAVTVFEQHANIGGACTTAELTLPGFRHDVGSSVYPLGVASPFFKSLPLHEHGLRWIEPDAAVAHPLDDGTAVTLEHSLEATVAQFGSHDARAWRLLFASSVRDWPKLVDDFTRPLLRIPSHPVAMATFGTAAILPADTLARAVFRSEVARALFAGCAAHSVVPLSYLASAAAGIVIATAGHTTGWPIVAGGAQNLSNALASYLRTLGGRIETGVTVTALAQLPPANTTLFDTGAQAFARIAGDSLSPSFHARLRTFKRGPGVFKVDWALSQPIPWRSKECLRSATVHLGGTLPELVTSEYAAFNGHHCERPYVLLTQPSLFDASRAPQAVDRATKHTAWAYCHVPANSTRDYTAIIEAQVERFAPGFRDCILARHTWNADSLAAWNPNLAAGDISGGAMTLTQMIARPTLRTYRTSNPHLYLCSSSTPPGGGVHGMCGHNAALAALSDHA